MELEQENLLLALAKRLWELNKIIVEQENREGKPDQKLRAEVIILLAQIRKMLAESDPLDKIRDPFVRDVLIKVREGNYFKVDIEAKNLRRLFDEYGDIVTEVLKRKGMPDFTEEQVNEYLDQKFLEFEKEIEEKIDVLYYFERKENFGNIITASKLPDKIHRYFPNIRDCFLFGQMYAVVGLCRVILEIAFKDKYRTVMPKVILFENYSFRQIVEEVCNRLNKKNLIKETMNLFKESSEVLHGGASSINLETDETLDFVHRTFNMIEKLYS